MKTVPLSVIIPTYNRADFLPRSIQSVLRQSRSCAEIIVVDDGSIDSTKTVVEEIAKQSRLPVYYTHQPNKGPSAARNTGIGLARNPYVAFLDSDDHWHKRKVEYQFSALSDSNEYRISHTYEKWLRRGEHLNQKKKHIPQHGDIFTHCLSLCAVGMSTVMLEKSIFDDVGFFDENMRCCEDYDFWLRVSSLYPFLLIPERLTVKEGGRDDQVSVQYRVGMDRFRIDALEKLIGSGVLNCEQKSATISELVHKATIFGEGCLKHQQIDIGTYYINLAESFKNPNQTAS